MTPSTLLAIKTAAAKHNVSALILCAVALTESNGDPYAYNEKEEAHGLFQQKIESARLVSGEVDIFDLYNAGIASEIAANRLRACGAKDKRIVSQIKCLNSPGWRKVKRNLRAQRGGLTFDQHTRKVLKNMEHCLDIEK